MEGSEKTKKRGWLSYAAVFAAGILTAIPLICEYLFFLPWISLIPLFLAAERKKSAYRHGLVFSLGYSHEIQLMLPKEVIAEVPDVRKGENPVLVLKSCDKQLVGQVAAKIRSFRKPEPYKGKGIKFVGEQLRRKAGKTAGAK